MDPISIIGFISSLSTLLTGFSGMLGIIAKLTNIPKYASELMQSISTSHDLFKILHDDIKDTFVIEAGDRRLDSVEKVTKDAKQLLRKLRRKMELPVRKKNRHSQNLSSRIKEGARTVTSRLSWIISEDDTKGLHRRFRTCISTLRVIHQSFTSQMTARVEIMMRATLLEHLSANPSAEVPKEVIDALEQSRRSRRTDLPVKRPQRTAKPLSTEGDGERVGAASIAKANSTDSLSRVAADLPIEKPPLYRKQEPEAKGCAGASSTVPPKTPVISENTMKTTVASAASVGAVVGTIAGGIAAGPVGAVFFLIWGSSVVTGATSFTCAAINYIGA